MRCILHIGTEKTGSTAIQSWIWQNHKPLAEKGFRVPSAFTTPNHQILAGKFQETIDDWFYRHQFKSFAERDHALRNLGQEIQEDLQKAPRSTHTVLLSTEHLHSKINKPHLVKQVKDFLDQFFSEITVLCYFREHAGFARSKYSTELMADQTEIYATWQKSVTPENVFFNHLHTADIWADVFGKENCIYRIFDRKTLNDGDIVADFIDAADIPTDQGAFVHEKKTVNQSLSLIEADMFRVINARYPRWRNLGDPLDQRNLILKQRVLKDGQFRLGEIPKTFDNKIRARFVENNTLFFNKYFDGRYLFPRT